MCKGYIYVSGVYLCLTRDKGVYVSGMPQNKISRVEGRGMSVLYEEG